MEDNRKCSKENGYPCRELKIKCLIRKKTSLLLAAIQTLDGVGCSVIAIVMGNVALFSDAES